MVVITASEASSPIAVSFVPEPSSAVDTNTFGSQIRLFDPPGRTNTSCDHCGKFGFVEKRSIEKAIHLEVPLVCTDCE